MGGSADNMRRYVLISIALHILISVAWGRIVVQKSVPIYGDTIEVSLRQFKFKKPEPEKKVVKKKKKKVKKRDLSPALEKTKKPAPREEPEEEPPEEVAEQPEEAAEQPAEKAYSVAKPSYGFTPRPPYPARAIRRGYEGTVLLSVHVLPNGEPDEVIVFKSSGYGILDEAALSAVKRWKFVPAQRGFAAVSSWVRVPIQFHLD